MPKNPPQLPLPHPRFAAPQPPNKLTASSASLSSVNGESVAMATKPAGVPLRVLLRGWTWHVAAAPLRWYEHLPWWVEAARAPNITALGEGVRSAGYSTLNAFPRWGPRGCSDLVANTAGTPAARVACSWLGTSQEQGPIPIVGTCLPPPGGLRRWDGARLGCPLGCSPVCVVGERRAFDGRRDWVR